MSPSSPNGSEPQQSRFDQVFRDSEGRIVIAQMPNPPLLIGVGAILVQQLIPEGNLRSGVGAVAFVAWLIWAWQETFTGVNYFRRSLGLTVLLGLLSLVALQLRSDTV